MTEPLDDCDAFFRAGFFEVFAIELVDFFEARDPDDALNGHLHPRTISLASVVGSFNMGADSGAGSSFSLKSQDSTRVHSRWWECAHTKPSAALAGFAAAMTENFAIV